MELSKLIHLDGRWTIGGQVGRGIGSWLEDADGEVVKEFVAFSDATWNRQECHYFCCKTCHASCFEHVFLTEPVHFNDYCPELQSPRSKEAIWSSSTTLIFPSWLPFPSAPFNQDPVPLYPAWASNLFIDYPNECLIGSTMPWMFDKGYWCIVSHCKHAIDIDSHAL